MRKGGFGIVAIFLLKEELNGSRILHTAVGLVRRWLKSVSTTTLPPYISPVGSRGAPGCSGLRLCRDAQTLTAVLGSPGHARPTVPPSHTSAAFYRWPLSCSDLEPCRDCRVYQQNRQNKRIVAQNRGQFSWPCYGSERTDVANLYGEAQLLMQ